MIEPSALQPGVGFLASGQAPQPLLQRVALGPPPPWRQRRLAIGVAVFGVGRQAPEIIRIRRARLA